MRGHNDPIAALQHAQRELSRKLADERNVARAEMWARLTKSVSGWKKVEQSGGVQMLNKAFDALVMQSRNRRIFTRRQKEYSAFYERVGLSSKMISELGAEAAMIFASVVPAQDQGLRDRGEEMLDAAAELSCVVEKLVTAVEEFRNALPQQSGGKGVLSDQATGGRNRFFREFAEVTRDVWRAAGLSIGGNGARDDGFVEFLGAVHTEVFGEHIPGRGALMADLRNTWPGPRFR